MPSLTCQSCGHPNDGAAHFCAECGVALPAAPPPPPPTLVAPTVAPVAAAPGAPVSPNRTPLIIAGAVVAVALIALVGFLLTRDGGDDSSEEFVASTVSTSSSTTSSATTPTTAAPPAPAPAPAPASNPFGLPSGLFCRDLDAHWYSYADSVDYWIAEGSPDRMDADLNGAPCETVYPLADIIAYWGFDPS